MKTFEIKHHRSGRILFVSECKSVKMCLQKAVESEADLCGADLRGADLRDADLCGADLHGAYLRDAYLYGAYLRDADLYGADLHGADLRDADLHGADLRGADLRDADLCGADGEKLKIEKTPLQILGLRWGIIIFDRHMKIGCEFHAIEAWGGFDDGRISQMDSHALEWWHGHKEAVLGFCKANNRN